MRPERRARAQDAMDEDAAPPALAPGRARADSLAVLLGQALRAGDQALLEKCAARPQGIGLGLPALSQRPARARHLISPAHSPAGAADCGARQGARQAHEGGAALLLVGRRSGGSAPAGAWHCRARSRHGMPAYDGACVLFDAASLSLWCARRRRCLAVGGDAVISKSVRGLRPPDAGALLVAAVARLQARPLRLTTPLLWRSRPIHSTSLRE